MSQLLWLTLIAGQATLAGIDWWLTPGDSPIALVVMAICLVTIIAPKKPSAALFPAVTFGILCFWMTCALSARLTFPRSIGFSWNITFLGSCALVALWWKQLRPRLTTPWLVPLFALPALFAGWSFPATQRAPDASTTPHGTPFGDLRGPVDSRMVKVQKNVQLLPSEARVLVRRDKAVLTVDPLLTFLDRSPERTWVGLAEPEETYATKRKLIGTQAEKLHWMLEYRDEDKSLLDVRFHDDAVVLDAQSSLVQPIYSRTNTYAELMVQGHKKLSVSFSPVPAQRIEVPASGAPSRFAYVDSANRFHVAEAKERKVGPFRELASGDLRGPLEVTLYDGDVAAYRVTLEDWASQASTQLSPTSGLPMNAIELAHAPGKDDAPAYIVFSLAETSIGRTSQSVGHAIGVYRNRMTITEP